MTQQREWPNAMRAHRDRAAEEVAEAAARLKRLKERAARGEFTRSGLDHDLAEALCNLQIALRHLEAAGAETVPE